MNRGARSPKLAPHVTIRVSGKLFQGHLPYVQELIRFAADCKLWPMLDLAHLEELDRPALLYLKLGEGHDFAIDGCPPFVREWINHEGNHAAA